MRVYMSLMIESVAGFIVLLPVLLLYEVRLLRKSGKESANPPIARILVTCLFGFLLLGILSATGVPSLYTLHMALKINLVPLSNLMRSPAQYMLNVILFVPLGFFLPLLWEKYENAWRTLLMGMLFSFAIEMAQIFAFRATDIDDLIMNTLGTAVGYFLFRLVQILFPSISILSVKRNTKPWNREPMFAFASAWAVMFFVQPLIAGWLWGFVISQTH